MTYGGTASCQGCAVGQVSWDTPYCYGPEALFDGLLDQWAGCSYSLMVTRSWPQAVSVSAVRFLARGGMVWPPRYALYASDDGASWTLLAQGGALQNQWTTVALPRFTARHLKLWFWSTDNLIYAQEVEVSGGPACTAAAGCATVAATVGEELSLSLSAAAVSFGAVAPSGSPPTVPAALAFTVRSNVPWDVLASARAPRLIGGTAELPATEYREGSAGFVPFPAQPMAVASGQPTAGETHVHDYRQEVPFTAPPGRYVGAVTYDVLAR